MIIACIRQDRVAKRECAAYELRGMPAGSGMTLPQRP
jgi:hypothetical protein